VSRSVAQAWVQTLADAGVTHMFGLIGTTILDLVDAVALEPRMRYVGVRHEQAASSMAAGFSRVTGRIAVCAAHGGAGAANLVLGVASAYKNSTPMIVITGSDRVSKLGRDAFNEIDVQRLFAPITKSTERIERPDDAVLKVRRALVRALSGRPGPVHIDPHCRGRRFRWRPALCTKSRTRCLVRNARCSTLGLGWPWGGLSKAPASWSMRRVAPLWLLMTHAAVFQTNTPRSSARSVDSGVRRRDARLPKRTW